MKVGTILFISMFLFAGSAVGTTLIQAQSGKKMPSQSLVDTGRVLVFTEPNCKPCRSLHHELAKCPAETKAKLAWVVVGPRRLARQWISESGSGLDSYFMAGKATVTTPTIRFHDQERVGILTCPQLQQWMETKI